MVQEFGGFVPRIAAGAWVHDSAVLIGDVTLEDGVSVWPTVVLRGDMGPIRVGRDSNLQDGVVCHDTTDRSETVVGERVTVGHRAILHGCRVEDDCLIGMGSIVMDNVVIGRGSFVAAGSLVTPNTVVPPGSFVRGSPARVIRPVEARDTESIAYSWKHYRETLQLWRAKAT